MPTLIKLTAPVIARKGDYLIIDKTGVRVLLGPEFEALLGVKNAQAGNHAKRKQRPKTEIAEMVAKVIKLVTELPRIKSGELYELAETKLTKGAFAKHLELMAKNGHIRREAVGGTPRHTMWAYYPVVK